MTRFVGAALVELSYESFGVGQVREWFPSTEILGVFVAFPFDTILQNALPQSAVYDRTDFEFIRFIFTRFILVGFIDRVGVAGFGGESEGEIIYHKLERTGIFTH
jgi:hypothetical protein